MRKLLKSALLPLGAALIIAALWRRRQLHLRLLEERPQPQPLLYKFRSQFPAFKIPAFVADCDIEAQVKLAETLGQIDLTLRKPLVFQKTDRFGSAEWFVYRETENGEKSFIGNLTRN